jgi:cyclophilin family peptidyl-prolyl cis-trans isomerase
LGIGSFVLPVVIVLVVAMAGCSSQSTDESTAAVLPSAVLPSAVIPEQQPPEVDLSNPIVHIKTSEGPIVLQLNAEKAPGTVRNFLDYVSEGFYTDTMFHYVDGGKMILGGGYTHGGQLKPTRLSIRNEAHNGLLNRRGTVAMARDSDLIDGATTQFFISLVDAPNLDHTDETAANYGYCVFGEVIEGLEIAERISQQPFEDRGGDLVQTPQTAVVIESIKLVR